MEHWIDVWTSYASVNAGAKANGGIRHLALRIAAANDGRGNRIADWLPTEAVMKRMEGVLEMVGDASVPHPVVDQHGRRSKSKPSTLTSLQIVSRPNTGTSLHLLHNLAILSRQPLFESLTQ